MLLIGHLSRKSGRETSIRDKKSMFKYIDCSKEQKSTNGVILPVLTIPFSHSVSIDVVNSYRCVSICLFVHVYASFCV